MEYKEFDYRKEKIFEEETNHLHFEYLENYLNKTYIVDSITEVHDKKTQKKAIDVIINLNNNKILTVELKTDKHPISPNLFLEDMSNIESHNLGWTLKCESMLLSYGFYDYNKSALTRLYFFQMPPLKRWFFNNYLHYEAKIINNKGYTSRGRAIPIEDVRKFIIWELKDEIKPSKPLTVGDFF